MERFADWLSEKLYLRGQIEIDQLDDISFALEVVFSHVISFGTVLLIGFIFNKNVEILIFIFMFGIFRTLNDRYHAKTFLKCFVLTVGSFLVSVFSSEIIIPELQNQFIIFLSLLNIILVIFSNNTHKKPIIMKYVVLMTILNLVIIACIPIIDKTLLVYIAVIAMILTISSIFSIENE